MSSNKAHAILNATLPRDARVPSDIALLSSADPMSLSLATLRGGQARVQAARDLGAKLHISSLITSALRGDCTNAKA